MRLHKVRCQRCGHWLANISLVDGLVFEVKCSKCCAVSKLLIENGIAVFQTNNFAAANGSRKATLAGEVA